MDVFSTELEIQLSFDKPSEFGGWFEPLKPPLGTPLYHPNRVITKHKDTPSIHNTSFQLPETAIAISFHTYKCKKPHTPVAIHTEVTT
jgi:hypothetical protein